MVKIKSIFSKLRGKSKKKEESDEKDRSTDVDEDVEEAKTETLEEAEDIQNEETTNSAENSPKITEQTAPGKKEGTVNKLAQNWEKAASTNAKEKKRSDEPQTRDTDGLNKEYVPPPDFLEESHLSPVTELKKWLVEFEITNKKHYEKNTKAILTEDEHRDEDEKTKKLSAEVFQMFTSTEEKKGNEDARLQALLRENGIDESLENVKKLSDSMFGLFNTKEEEKKRKEAKKLDSSKFQMFTSPEEKRAGNAQPIDTSSPDENETSAAQDPGEN